MADAYAGVTGEFETYRAEATAPQADVLAAVSQAAHDTLSALFSDQRADFDAALVSVLDAVADGEAEREGVAYGAYAAETMLAAREDDGADDAVVYPLTGVPGDYAVDPLHPDQVPLSPGWGSVAPFVIDSSTEFGPPPFPSLTVSYTHLTLPTN